MSDAFEEFQARVRAGERACAESDLYWRTNRWAEDGYGTGAVAMKAGEFTVVAFGENVGMSSYSSYFKSNKSNPPEVGRIFRR